MDAPTFSQLRASCSMELLRTRSVAERPRKAALVLGIVLVALVGSTVSLVPSKAFSQVCDTACEALPPPGSRAERDLQRIDARLQRDLLKAQETAQRDAQRGARDRLRAQERAQRDRQRVLRGLEAEEPLGF